jgi:isoleucyl-tRNA synthetase
MCKAFLWSEVEPVCLIPRVGTQPISVVDAVKYRDMVAVDRWVLHELWQLRAANKEHYTKYGFSVMLRGTRFSPLASISRPLTRSSELLLFSTSTLSAYYFSITKDRLYCSTGTTVLSCKVSPCFSIAGW